MLISKEETPITPLPTEAPKTSHRLLRALSIFVGFILICVIAVLVVVAKTGLVRIPVVSSVVKSVAEPASIVSVPPQTSDVVTLLKLQVEGAVARYARVPTEENRLMELRLSDSSVTKSLKGQAFNLGPEVKAKESQVLFRKDYAQFFTKIEWQGKQSSLLVNFIPEIKNGNPVLRINKFVVGTLPLPASVLNALVQKELDKELAGFSAQIATLGRLDSLEMRDGAIILKGTLATGVANGIR